MFWERSEFPGYHHCQQEMQEITRTRINNLKDLLKTVTIVKEISKKDTK